jgi:hypothetical protein
MKNSNDTIGNRSRDLPVCSAVPQSLRHRVPPLYASYLAQFMADKSFFQQKLKVYLNACRLSNFTSNPDSNILRTFFQSNYTHSEQLAVLCFLALLVFHKDSEIQQNNNERSCYNALKFESLYLLTVIITTAHYGPGWHLGQ